MTCRALAHKGGWSCSSSRSHWELKVTELTPSSLPAEYLALHPTTMDWHLTVKMLDGNGFLVPMNNSMTLPELKREIAKKTGVPAFQQRLAIHPSKKELQDGKSLTQQGVVTGSVVLMLVKDCKDPISILVTNDKGRSRLYEVQLTQTVVTLKRQVCQQEGVREDMFYLSFEGKPMEDEHMLGDYDLKSQCTVFMNLRLRGGRAGPSEQCRGSPAGIKLW